MTPGTMPMALRRNASGAVRLALADGTGAPYDLTGCSLKLEVRLYAGAAGPALLSLSSGGGEITVEDAPGGIVEIDWPSVRAQIAALPTGAELGDPMRPAIDTYAYDLLLIDADGLAQAIIEWPVPVSYGVTQP